VGSSYAVGGLSLPIAHNTGGYDSQAAVKEMHRPVGDLRLPRPITATEFQTAHALGMRRLN